MSGRQRLRVCDVDNSAQAILRECFHQRVSDHHRPSGSVHEKRSRLHQANLGRPDQPVRLCRQRHNSHNNICLRQKPA